MSWERFRNYYLNIRDLGFSLDISRMMFDENFLGRMEPRMREAFIEMDKLEKGSIANPDEKRMVGHYWLRNSDLAPSSEIKMEIDDVLMHIKEFARKIHTGEIEGETGKFKNLLVIGIGGSALGPQFVGQALGDVKEDELATFFFDNTDPDGFDMVLDRLDGELGRTLVIVISKSGSTPETRNGMIEAELAYTNVKLNFAKHAVAITEKGSQLDELAKKNNWLDSFPLWDWVGGRTSELAAVGLLPAALQGIDIDEMLRGAREMDKVTRSHITRDNPAALLALMWYYATDGKGKKDMVILPYKERLSLFSKYLQQLIMESLGKEKDLLGNTVHQGIAVYGNKGSTDQHAYVQQLREGVNNFFVTFIEVLKDREGASAEVSPKTTSGDYLQAFLLGTRDALSENGRDSITITIDKVSPYTVGALIALYERAVGLYAFLININAYNQPGVEAGKKAAARTLQLKDKVMDYLGKNSGKQFHAMEIAESIGSANEIEIIYKILEHLTVNSGGKIVRSWEKSFDKSKYGFIDKAD